jgi:hypothetical protein
MRDEAVGLIEPDPVARESRMRGREIWSGLGYIAKIDHCLDAEVLQ